MDPDWYVMTVSPEVGWLSEGAKLLHEKSLPQFWGKDTHN